MSRPRKIKHLQFLEIRRRFASGETRKSLSITFNIDYSLVCKYIKHPTRKWKW